MKTAAFLTLFFVCLNLTLCENIHAMTEEELCQTYLGVVEDAVEFFEPLWTDDSTRVPNSGFFDFRKYGNWMDEPYATIIVVPGNGMVDFCYSVLLTETKKETFTKRHVPRFTLLDHAIKSIRWCCLTSAYVDHPYDYLPHTRPEFLVGKHWRRSMGYRADEVGWLTLAAAKLWPLLDTETKKLVEAVMIGGAPKERLVRTWYARQAGNHDQVKQDLSSTVGAAYLFPKRADADQYLNIIAGNGVDMVSTLQDQTCDTVAEGKPIREWSKGWNLYQDYSSDHHGWMNIWYGGDMLFEGRSYVELLSALTGRRVPETFTYQGNGFDGVLDWLKALCLPQGEPASPHGNEYDTYYGAGLLAYCYGAVVRKDPVSAALEERAADLLQRHSRAAQLYDYHRNSWAKAATAFLLHKYAGPRANPVAFEQACRSLDGTYHYQWQQDLIHRCRDKWVSFAWGTISSHRVVNAYHGTGLCGIVVPAQPASVAVEPFIYCHPRSLIGEIRVAGGNIKELKELPFEPEYKFARNDIGFHTAGVVSDPFLKRYYAFYSFSDGPCVLLSLFRATQKCRVSWSGLPIYFYVRNGLTSPRTLYDAKGRQPLGQSAVRASAWWCVDDAIGVATLGGNGRLVTERSVGYNWARKKEYKDKCDGVFVSPMPEREIQAGENAADLAVGIYVNTPHKRLARMPGSLQSVSDQLPDGWRGLVTPDAGTEGKRFLAVAHFYGDQQQALIDLSFKEGAPVTSAETLIRGRNASVFLTLSSQETLAGPLELYLKTKNGKEVRAQRITQNRYRLEPVEPGKTSVGIQYCGKEIESFLLYDLNGKLGKRISPSSDRGRFSGSFTLNQPSILEIRGKSFKDPIGPAVEISRVSVREDGRVTVEALAGDQNGIQNVDLYCDHQRIGQQSGNSTLWTMRPGEGPHTFYAVATDRSAQHNRRTSFKRTVMVHYPHR